MRKSLFKIMLSLTVLIVLGIMVKVFPASADIKYSITDLGPGNARDINNLGQVIGETFFWDPITGRQDLPEHLVSINDSGIAVGLYDIWDSNSGQWGSLPINGRAINNSGVVAGSFGSTPSPCIWDSVNGEQCLNDIIGVARDINDSGQICIERGSGKESLVWDSVNGIIQYIPTLGGAGAYSEALGMNNLGQVVGGSTIADGGPKHAFIWDSFNGTQDLGTLYGSSSEANDINILGQVVGHSTSSVPVEGWHGVVAFIQDSTNGMQDLNDLIPPDSGWILGWPWAINDQGQIVGIGCLDGYCSIDDIQHAFLLTPLPSPIPHIVVSPLGYNFERVVVDHPSDPLSITIYNYGDVDLLVSDMSLSDDINYFLDGDTTATIEPGGSHVVIVTFSPQSMGEHDATLSITSNAPLKPNVNVQLTGEGEAAIWGCINYKGSPLDGLVISLVEKRGQNQTAITDSDGCYRFERIRDKGGTMKVNFPAISP